MIKGKTISYTNDDLYQFLIELQDELVSVNDETHSILVRRAIDFRCGSVTEFLGESRIVLDTLALNKTALKKATLMKIKFYLELIDDAFTYIS